MIENTDLVEIGKRVRLLRAENDITREKLAEQTGLSSETIKRVEKGCNYSMSTFLKLISGLNTNANYLCYGESNDKFRQFVISLYENSRPDEFINILKRMK